MEFIKNFVSFARHRNKRTVLNILDIVACYTYRVRMKNLEHLADRLVLSNRRLILYRSVISHA